MKKQKKLVLSLILVLVLVIFSVLNTEPVEINFGASKPKVPLIIILVVMLLLGALITWLIGRGDPGRDVKKALETQEKSLTHKYQSELDQKEQKIKQLQTQLDTSKKVKTETADSKQSR